MTTEADIGHGTTLEYAHPDTPEAFTAMGEITNVTPPPMTRDVIDATHMQSPDRWREYIAGLRDGGEMSIDLNFVPGSTTDVFLVNSQIENFPRPYRITYPDGSVETFDAFNVGYERGVPVDDKMTGTATFKVTGPVETVPVT